MWKSKTRRDIAIKLKANIYLFVKTFSLSNHRVYADGHRGRYIHKNRDISGEILSNEFISSEAGFFISNVFLHGSCISYKSCNEKTTKISSSLLFKREERGKVFVQQKLQNCWEI